MLDIGGDVHAAPAGYAGPGAFVGRREGGQAGEGKGNRHTAVAKDWPWLR